MMVTVRLEDMALEPGMRVLDLGCGSGILAIASAMMWRDADVIAVDNDPVAVDIAIENAALNNTPNITFMHSEGFDHEVFKQEPRYGLIIANILAEPIIHLAPQICHYLAKDGQIILSGLLTKQADDVIDAFATYGVHVKTHNIREEWSVLLMQGA